MKNLLLIFTLIYSSMATGIGDSTIKGSESDDLGTRLNGLLNSDPETSTDGLNLNSFLIEAQQRRQNQIKSITASLISSYAALDPFKAYAKVGSTYCTQLLTAAQLGHADSQYGIGLCHLMDWIKPATHKTAYEMFSRASQMQHSNAVFFKALMELEHSYKWHTGTSMESFQAIQKAQTQGSHYAQIYIHFLRFLNGKKAASHLAFQNLKRAAQNKDPLANFITGMIYEKSLKDFKYSKEKVMKFYKTAEDFGYTPASRRLQKIISNSRPSLMLENFFSVLNQKDKILNPMTASWTPDAALTAMFEGDRLELDPIMGCQISCWWRDLSAETLATTYCADCMNLNLVKQAKPRSDLAWNEPQNLDQWLASEPIQKLKTYNLESNNAVAQSLGRHIVRTIQNRLNKKNAP